MRRFDVGMEAMWDRYAAVERLLDRPGDDGSDEGENAPWVEALTERETDVLRLLQGSLTVGEISSLLHLSTNTVKTHARAVYRKLGVHSRTDAVAAARRHGLF